MKKSIPKFFAKSALQRGEIASKERSYNDGIEIQLLSELVNGEIENMNCDTCNNDLGFFQINPGDKNCVFKEKIGEVD